MRTFDKYFFDISTKAKVSDFGHYIENLLKELNYEYRGIIFETDTYPRGGLIEKFPNLEKYFKFEHDYEQERAKYYSYDIHWKDYGTDWKNGNIYADSNDKEQIFELNFKRHKGNSLSYSLVIFDQINWGENTISYLLDDKYYKYPAVKTEYFINNQICIYKGYCEREWNLSVTIESTSDGQPKDTLHIVEKLIPFLGNPIEKHKIYKPSIAETTFNKEDEKECLMILNERFENTFRDEKHDGNFSNILDKRKLKKAFENTHFVLENNGNLLRGMNRLIYRNKYDMTFEITFDRLPHFNAFRWNIRIYGFNFSISPFKALDDIGVNSQEEVELYLKKVADFCEKLGQDEEYNNLLLRTYGETPFWYYEM